MARLVSTRSLVAPDNETSQAKAVIHAIGTVMTLKLKRDIPWYNDTPSKCSQVAKQSYMAEKSESKLIKYKGTANHSHLVGNNEMNFQTPFVWIVSPFPGTTFGKSEQPDSASLYLRHAGPRDDPWLTGLGRGRTTTLRPLGWHPYILGTPVTLALKWYN